MTLLNKEERKNKMTWLIKKNHNRWMALLNRIDLKNKMILLNRGDQFKNKMMEINLLMGSLSKQQIVLLK